MSLHPRTEESISEQAARDINLLQGEAAFKVEHNPLRPFSVHTGSALIEDIGTEFHVYRRPTNTVVAVLEGAVEISPDRQDFNSAVADPRSTSKSVSGTTPMLQLQPDRTRVAAGEEARVGTDGTIQRRTPIAVDQMKVWRQPRLLFSGDTLSDIAGDFNRYNRDPQIRIEGKALLAKRFSGSFDAHDPASLVDYLRQNAPITVERAGNQLVIRERASEVVR